MTKPRVRGKIVTSGKQKLQRINFLVIINFNTGKPKNQRMDFGLPLQENENLQINIIEWHFINN